MHRMYIGQFSRVCLFHRAHSARGNERHRCICFHSGYPSLPMGIAALYTQHHIASRSSTSTCSPSRIVSICVPVPLRSTQARMAFTTSHRRTTHVSHWFRMTQRCSHWPRVEGKNAGDGKILTIVSMITRRFRNGERY